jgi:hypothetical protein
MGENPLVPATASTLRDDAAHRAGDEPDAVCAAAEPLARRAAGEIADPDTVGAHLNALADGDRTVTHLFECLAKGYRGWRWAVTLARAPRSRTATVSEVVLLPGEDAVLAPTWVPWSDRIAPGDLGATDALPYRVEDPYLEPGYTVTDDEDADRTALWELGLGRVRVLSPEGRDAAADRWYHGDRGPTAEEAISAAAACASCGYFLPVSGSLRLLFGVCGNEWSPSDGRVVSVDHGCGAHSETDVERIEPQPLPEPILDETGHEAVVIDRRPPVSEETPVEAAPDVVPVGADAEPPAGDAATITESLVTEPVTAEDETEPVTAEDETEPVATESAAPEPAADAAEAADADIVADGEPGPDR